MGGGAVEGRSGDGGVGGEWRSGASCVDGGDGELDGRASYTWGGGPLSVCMEERGCRWSLAHGWWSGVVEGRFVLAWRSAVVDGAWCMDGGAELWKGASRMDAGAGL